MSEDKQEDHGNVGGNAKHGMLMELTLELALIVE